MGKTRKKQGFDSSYKQDQLEIKINCNINLPEELQELKENLSNEGKLWLTGEVILDGIVEPVVFMPYTRDVEGKLKMYSRVAFSELSQITFTQNLIDRISRKVCRKIKNRGKKLTRLNKV